jgi:hypothetical protein
MKQETARKQNLQFFIVELIFPIRKQGRRFLGGFDI